MPREPVLAAGGIVLRHEPMPLIAVVRLRKRDEWVLPKGKLDDGETPLAAAKREVLEETGHDVTVHEFLGTLVYEISGRSKVVHYWRMEARGGQTHELMNDIRAVDWLPLEAALQRLSRLSERAFLANVGPRALLNLSRETRPKAQLVRKRRGRNVIAPELSPAQPSRPDSLPAEAAHAEIGPPLAASVCEPPASAPVADAVAPVEPALEPIVSGALVPGSQVEAVEPVVPTPPTEVVEAAVESSAPAPLAEPASGSAAGAGGDRADGGSDRRRWSLAQKVRDWLGLAA